MNTYMTSEIAAMIGIHPNTVRLYEELGLIPKPERLPNGYRVFTDIHLEQFRLARTAFQIEILQNGLRKKIVGVVKTSAAGDFDRAISLAEEYLKQVRQEIKNAEEAITIVRVLLAGRGKEESRLYTRKEITEALNITVDTLRNWEMNGLLTVRRKQNGYRIYTEEDRNRLTMIRSLRCANYSLEAILRMLGRLSAHPQADITDIRAALNTPGSDTDIISACDKLIVSLTAAENNALKIIGSLRLMKTRGRSVR